MDAIDRKILNTLQKEFPLAKRPFAEVAEKCGVSEEEALARIRKMKDSGVVRRIGAVFDGVKLGRASTLCAARVSADKIDVFVKNVNAEKNVTHNYRRNNEYNIWFTLSVADRKEIEFFLERLKEATGVTDIIEMRATRTFKINASFEV